MKLIIDRTKWNGGHDPHGSMLRDPYSGKMCCLGFYCLAIGKTESEINLRTMPGSLSNIEGLEALVTETHENSRLARALAHVNDSNPNDRSTSLIPLTLPPTNLWTLPQREAKITELFKQIDVEVEFIN